MFVYIAVFCHVVNTFLSPSLFLFLSISLCICQAGFGAKAENLQQLGNEERGVSWRCVCVSLCSWIIIVLYSLHVFI